MASPPQHRLQAAQTYAFLSGLLRSCRQRLQSYLFSAQQPRSQAVIVG